MKNKIFEILSLLEVFIYALAIALMSFNVMTSELFGKIFYGTMPGMLIISLAVSFYVKEKNTRAGKTLIASDYLSLRLTAYYCC